MRTDPWMEATITWRETLTSSCHIIRVRPQSTLTNLITGQAINMSLLPPNESRRVSSFTVLSTQPGGEFNLLVRSTGAGGVSDGLMSATDLGEPIWVSDSVPTVKLPSPVEDETILCLVAGSGASILGGLVENHSLKGTDVVFVGRDDDLHAIPAALAQHLSGEGFGFAPRTWTNWNSTERGRPDENDIEALVGNKSRYAAIIACGPDGFCQLVQNTCIQMGFDDERLAIEAFGGAAAPMQGGAVSASSTTAVIDLFGETHAVNWPEGDNLISAMLNAGLEAPYSCRAGICSTCQCSVVIGDAEMDTDLGLSDEEKASGLSLACQLRPVSHAVAVRFAAAQRAMR